LGRLTAARVRQSHTSLGSSTWTAGVGASTTTAAETMTPSKSRREPVRLPFGLAPGARAGL